MRFIDYENFVPVAGRSISDVLPQFPHLIDAAVGCRIDLDDVHARTGRDLTAAGTDSTRLCGRTVYAVQTPCDNARHCRLPCATLTGEYVAMGDTALCDRIAQGRADVLLTDQLRELRWPVFPGDDLVHGSALIVLATGRWEYARPRVIRGTRAKPLPLLPSGPGGVCSRPLHGAQGLTNYEFST